MRKGLPLGFFLVVVAVALWTVGVHAQQSTGTTNFSTVADISGTGATVKASSSVVVANWVQISTPSTNAAVVRWGGASTAVGQGSQIAPGGGQLINQSMCPCDLSKLNLYIANGDKVSLTWGN